LFGVFEERRPGYHWDKETTAINVFREGVKLALTPNGIDDVDVMFLINECLDGTSRSTQECPRVSADYDVSLNNVQSNSYSTIPVIIFQSSSLHFFL